MNPPTTSSCTESGPGPGAAPGPLPRLLYLGSCFPPGIQYSVHELNPAGHLLATYLVNSIRPWFDIRSTGLLPVRLDELSASLSPSACPGLPNDLNLLETKPQLLHRWQSLRLLKKTYRDWQRAGWTPDAIMVNNLSPVYNAFLRWLPRAPGSPKLILYLSDSTMLGLPIPLLKRLRYRLKPMVYLEEDMLPLFHACVAVNRATEKLFSGRNAPWLWLPSGCDPARAITSAPTVRPDEPIRFGYFGFLAPHTGLQALIKIFTARKHPSTLHLCGFGKQKAEIARMCQSDSRLHFYGSMNADECLRWAQQVDVLVNPRPIFPGNDNNFPSKVFEYALAGRAILTSRLSGVDLVLGPGAFYFDERDFEASLARQLEEIGRMPRSEVQQRGLAVQQRMLQQWSWSQQGQKLASFISRVLGTKSS